MTAADRAFRPRRTVLAVPGSSDRFIAKSRVLDVDAVMLDLEDAVASAAKAEARQRVAAAVLEGGWLAPTLTVRVNAWTSPWTLRDLLEVVGPAAATLGAVVLPKVTSPDQVAALDLVLTQVEHEAGVEIGQIGIEAQIEDATGMSRVAQIAAASPRLESLVFGPGDYMASLGMASLSVGGQLPGYPGDYFHHALATILVAARSHGLQAIDGPYVAIADVPGFTASAMRAAALGMDGKWVLHPAQIDAGRTAFTPSAALVERAERIVAAHRAAASGEAGAAATGAIVVDGEMVDEAGVQLALAILARAGSATAADDTPGQVAQR